MASNIRDRAALEAVEVLRYFSNITALGAFIGEETDQHKLDFLTTTIVNFVRRENIFFSHDEEKPER